MSRLAFNTGQVLEILSGYVRDLGSEDSEEVERTITRLTGDTAECSDTMPGIVLVETAGENGHARFPWAQLQQVDLDAMVGSTCHTVEIHLNDPMTPDELVGAIKAGLGTHHCKEVTTAAPEKVPAQD